MTRDEYSGVLECKDDTLIYRSVIREWSIPISGVRLIAEYTNSDGPYIDDYFFVFLTALEGGWHEASFYAEGRDAALRAIEQKIGAPLETGLCYSTDYRTRIMWPESVKGQPLMDIIPPKHQNWWQKLIDSGARDIALSDAARKVFE
jgi:hypothetical protein